MPRDPLRPREPQQARELQQAREPQQAREREPQRAREPQHFDTGDTSIIAVPVATLPGGNAIGNAMVRAHGRARRLVGYDKS